MNTVKQLAEETFGKTKDGKGFVTLDDAIKFANKAVEQNKFKWNEIKTAPLEKRLLGLVLGRRRKLITQIAYCPNAREWYGEFGLEDIEITHWMPLPEFPEIGHEYWIEHKGPLPPLNMNANVFIDFKTANMNGFHHQVGSLNWGMEDDDDRITHYRKSTRNDI